MLTSIPEFSRDLIDKLNETFPERCPSMGDSERDIFFYAGQRALVRQLSFMLVVQDEEAHESVLKPKEQEGTTTNVQS